MFPCSYVCKQTVSKALIERRKAYLDEKVKMALVKAVKGGRGIATHDDFSANLCGHLDVLSNRQTKCVVLVGQGEAITGKS